MTYRVIALSLVACLVLCVSARASDWLDPANKIVLHGRSIEATFQSGIPIEVKSVSEGTSLIHVAPDQLHTKLPLFGPGPLMDLSACRVTQHACKDSLTVHIVAPNGLSWEMRWSFDASGDLVLRSSAQAHQVGEMRILMFGCDLQNHTIVCVNNVGVGQQATAPWKGAFRGDPEGNDFSESYVQPLILLFQGKDSGWVIEGRDPDVGPANVLARGNGQTADIAFARGFPIPTDSPEMFELRIRAYRGDWHDAVEPYIQWMQTGLGFVPLEQQKPAWVKDIKANSWVLCGDYASLDVLARELIPSKTILSRNNTYRNYPVDIGYPDYRLTDAAKQWVKRARELGFHVGIWINTTGVDSDTFPELAKKFRPGFKVIGHDANGNEQYWSIPGRQIYGSAAYKRWRDYLVEQLKDAADAGVECVHLDEADTPTGKFLVDGTTAIEGVYLLEKAIRDAYPQMAIETEEFNPMCSRAASFCFSEFDDGHPLGGYLFHRFIKFIPESYLAAPALPEYMDANERWGFFMPSADAKWSTAWLPIARAFQDFDLNAAPRAKLQEGQLSAYAGKNGVTAAFEKEATRRGLVIREPGKLPRWVGARYFGIKTWPGPGSLASWPAYDGSTLIGLDATKSYTFDENRTPPAEQFHITKVPDDFTMFTDPYLDIRPGEDSGHDVARDGSWFRIKMLGHGDVSLFVPDDVLVYQDGTKVSVDRQTKSAKIHIDASGEKFSLLWAFRKSDTLLVGKCTALPFQFSPRQRDGHFVAKGADFSAAVTSTGLLIGKLPSGKHIHIRGSYALQPGSVIDVGDNRGVIRVNGKVVSSTLIVGAKRPYPTQDFDADISEFSGQNVVIEFICDGFPHLWAMATWIAPRIEVEE